MKTSLITLALVSVLSCSANAEHRLATYRLDTFWRGQYTPGGSVHVEVPGSDDPFKVPVLGVDEPSRVYTDAFLSAISVDGVEFWLTSLGYADGGYLGPNDPLPSVSLSSIRETDFVELVVTELVVTPDHFDDIIEFAFDFHLYVAAPEPGSLSLLLAAACLLGCKRHRQ